MIEVLKSLAVTSCFAWIAACSVEASNADPNDPYFAVGGSEGKIESEGVEVGTSCPADNLTEPCTCQVGGKTYAGRQTCTTSAGWSECECAAQLAASGFSGAAVSDPGSNKNGSTFDWKETEPSTILPGGGGSCKGGHYSGFFSGFYNSPRMGPGDATFSPVGIPVLGNVEFDLHQLGNGEYFEIRDGAMEGAALVVFPFKGDLVGTINCSGSEPVVEIDLKNGTYFAIDLPYYFDGKAVAVYNKQEFTFDLGEWAVTEPEDYTVVVRNEDGTADLSQTDFAPLPSLTPGVPPMLDIFVEGGTGEWNAIWVGPETGVGSNP
ncbi:MAG: hypothetical protein JXA30_22710 [Deltaproteobacteria bacterium]|nr:hypothetical protein [Deltaproteobacteria bacterium]